MRAFVQLFGSIATEGPVNSAWVRSEIGGYEGWGFRELVFVLKSDGGDIDEAAAIVEEIQAAQDRGLKTAALIEDSADSAASWIALACGDILARPHATMRIHHAQVGEQGTPAEQESARKLAKAWDASMQKLYATKSQRPAARFAELMDADSRLDAFELLDLGLVDQVLPARGFPPEMEAA
jgi:ATP-dependent Clp protease protease subunit